jgi:hypothetical protein
LQIQFYQIAMTPPLLSPPVLLCRSSAIPRPTTIKFRIPMSISTSSKSKLPLRMHSSANPVQSIFFSKVQKRLDRRISVPLASTVDHHRTWPFQAHLVVFCRLGMVLPRQALVPVLTIPVIPLYSSKPLPPYPAQLELVSALARSYLLDFAITHV